MNVKWIEVEKVDAGWVRAVVEDDEGNADGRAFPLGQLGVLVGASVDPADVEVGAVFRQGNGKPDLDEMRRRREAYNEAVGGAS